MTPTFPDISISTERLVLRSFDEGDVPALTAMMNDELVAARNAAPAPCTEADAREWVVRRAPAVRADGDGLALAMADVLTGRLVGGLRLRRTDWRLRTAEAYCATAPWARGEGYACESLLGLVQWLFQDQKFERLEPRTAADNTAAQQVAQKLGCVSEGVLRSAWITRTRAADGTWQQARTDLIVWSLLPEDLDGLPERIAQAGGAVPRADWT
ncbi:GNAT family N-acetyltransferase [Streptomyces sp. TR06-5]|uniref:GNAT family N-acetyltransferase n=1 Tax=Streptomyces sp. TR06-5 TaxID=3385976 RepID=UPI0039A14608